MKKNICKYCTFYTAYYEKFSSNFSRLSHGFCKKQNIPQLQFKTCDDFKSNEQKEKMREKRLFSHLEQSLISINAISHILKEKTDEQN